MTDHDRDHLPGILQGEGTWFTANLLRLIAKADSVNRNKLRQGYPLEVGAVERYQRNEEGTA